MEKRACLGQRRTTERAVCETAETFHKTAETFQMDIWLA
jgi:hypothetical protein